MYFYQLQEAIFYFDNIFLSLSSRVSASVPESCMSGCNRIQKYDSHPINIDLFILFVLTNLYLEMQLPDATQ